MSRTSKPDPRIERTIKLLGDSLRELIVERGYDVLTVQDITDRANVSRTTFYLHFKDKDELLFTTMRQIYRSLTGHFQHRLEAVRTFEDFERIGCDTTDYDHVAENADFYRVMLGKHGSAAFIQVILNYLTEEMSTTLLKPMLEDQPNLPVPVEFIAAFTAGAEIGLMNWWLQNDMRIPAEQMAKMQYWLSVGGLAAVMGMIGESAMTQAAAEADAT